MTININFHIETEPDGMAEYWFTVKRGDEKEFKICLVTDDVVAIIICDLIETYATTGNDPEVSAAIECLVRKVYGEWGSYGTTDEILAQMEAARGRYETDELES